MRSNNTNLLLFSLLLLVLTGCGQTARIAKPVDVTLPDAPRQLEKVSEADQYLYDRALTALQKGDSDEAEALFLQLIKQHRELTGPHLNLAIIHYQRGATKKAEEALKTVLHLDPRNATAYTLQGVILREQNRFRDAEVAYIKAIRSDPKHAPAHLNLAILYDLYFQYYEDAGKHYQHYLDLHGSDEQVEQWLAAMQRRK